MRERTVCALAALVLATATTWTVRVGAESGQAQAEDIHEHHRHRPVNCLVISGTLIYTDGEGRIWVWNPRLGWMGIYTRQVMAASWG